MAEASAISELDNVISGLESAIIRPGKCGLRPGKCDLRPGKCGLRPGKRDLRLYQRDLRARDRDFKSKTPAATVVVELLLPSIYVCIEEISDIDLICHRIDRDGNGSGNSRDIADARVGYNRLPTSPAQPRQEPRPTKNAPPLRQLFLIMPPVCAL